MKFIKIFLITWSLCSINLVAQANNVITLELSEISQYLESGHTYISRTSVDGGDHSCQIISFLLDSSDPSKFLYLPEGGLQLGIYPNCEIPPQASDKLLILNDEDVSFQEKSATHRMFDLENEIVEINGNPVAVIQGAEYDEEENTLILKLFSPLVFSNNVYKIDLNSETRLN